MFKDSPPNLIVLSWNTTIFLYPKELQRLRQARKEGAASIGLITAEIIKVFLLFLGLSTCFIVKEGHCSLSLGNYVSV